MGQYEFPNPEWADVSQEGEFAYPSEILRWAGPFGLLESFISTRCVQTIGPGAP